MTTDYTLHGWEISLLPPRLGLPQSTPCGLADCAAVAAAREAEEQAEPQQAVAKDKPKQARAVASGRKRCLMAELPAAELGQRLAEFRAVLGAEATQRRIKRRADD